MVPIGYQEVPQAQTDFFKKEVPVENTDTTIFIGEVSRGRHEAMYARKWTEVVKDIECLSPDFYNIRKPELGVQTRVKKVNPADKEKEEATEEEKKAEETPAEEGEKPDAKGKKKKKEKGNLHCLICFRNDEEEPNPDRFENASEESEEEEME
ncbi:hypothetical protein AGDE_13654 [Angomonas deanei]|uniref:Uncharacterized protein n=1 Tax=Angomonas deanei TaxID=59799 RepID=A0A7G2CMD5_9TRYP|nr:hypothetical protein AGDE_13654 [Angomonas deanei]CAD2220071.1 hypothetical protein, conserved [Angomonas deanei]|eukprot:EPY21936.1 hypothetical protein AGDE_13654 [Angomonas deanei]